jgi:pilus assembly protein FimV
MRALARWGITPLLAAPLGAWALGLGDIELQSALNQPFKAQIALIATPEELQGLKIALAPPEMFERRGLDRPGFLTRLEFRIVANAAGRPIVQVSSRESVAEPFVTLLVEATWARGRQYNEYTVLLDPPVLLPGPAVDVPVQPPQTRPATPGAPGGAINRPAPREPAQAPAPASPPRTEPAPQPAAPAPRSNDAPRVTPTSAPGGSYGPVQRAETLWAIADRYRPDGVSMNQMMVAMYRANPQAFGGNMNVLKVGATLRLPESADFQELATTVANAEVQRQTDEWSNRSPQQRALRLLPPAEAPAAAASPVPQAPPSRTPAVTPSPETPAAPPNAVANNADAEESRRILELRNEELRNLQNQAANAPPEQPADAPAGEPAPAVPGVALEPEEPLFADETPDETPEPEAAPAEPAPAPAAPPIRAPESPSIVARVMDWLASPVLWIGVGVALTLIAALLFVRRRRQEPEDITGRWEALESEVDDEEVREATERMRRQLPEESIVVEETTRSSRREAEVDPPTETRPRSAAPRGAGRAAPAPADETLSSQTVINLDQADPVAEADFHMAYGLYDQAAELVQKALDAAPQRRDLKLKLLEVFFVWGNKDAFLNAAQSLRKEIGQKADPDWDKVVIMGKQICPDERLFAEAASVAGAVDVDLQAGDSPLDLAFDEASGSGLDLDLGLGDADDGDLETSGTRELKAPSQPAAAKKPARPELDSSLDIGERTAAGLEAAFFELGDADKDDPSQTMPDLAADSLAATQESPTVESPRSGRDWARDAGESPTAEFSLDAPTVETPTIESPGPDSPTMETPTVETPFRRNEQPTVEQPTIETNQSDLTAEIDLDDLGLDVKDIEGLPQDLGDLPTAGADGDTREQPALRGSDDLLSATGVTQVLRGGVVEDDDEDLEQRKTSVLTDEDATMLAPGFGDDNTLTGTEVLEHRFEFDKESGDTSLVKALKKEDNLDLNLDDLSAALHGADTVEQPRSSSFSNDVFGGGATPLDMEIGDDTAGADDPTGTEEVGPLDPQTMTEVGTKLDLARAYIDMGDPEGARSILEEVLDEGDPNQRREAQSLIDVLSA